ncbi:MAG: hypothetical protein N3Z29_08170 [Synechococcaceae cyanobacterium MAG-AL1]|nr:hypothetical protein [Candidatus Regnicoccus frigidus MAG-AL1]
MKDLSLTEASLVQAVFVTKFFKRLSSIQIYDGILPLVIIIHSYSDHETAALGLLVIWMALRLTIRVFRQHREHPTQPPFDAIFLILLLVNTRVIVLREDINGASNFLIIAIGFVIGLRQSWRQWRISLGWLALTSVVLAVNFLLVRPAPVGWTHTLVRDVYVLTMNGHGGINRFATILLLVTLSSVYYSLLSRSTAARAFGVVAALIGYSMCFSTDSRLAQAAPPTALLVGWLVPRFWKGSIKIILIVAASLITAGLILGLWWFYLAPDASVNLSSDLGRLAAGGCWLSLMFTGSNRFVYGVGFGPKANQMCGHLKDGAGFGHAHNTIAQMGGQLGLLGIIAFLILVIIVVMGFSRQRMLMLSLKNRDFHNIGRIQVAVGLNSLLMMNVLATTIYRGNQVTQCLIGFLASTSLCLAINPRNEPSTPDLPRSPLLRSSQRLG